MTIRITDVGTMDNNVIDKTHPAWKLARMLDVLRADLVGNHAYLIKHIDLETLLMILIAMAIRTPDATGGLVSHKGNPTHAVDDVLAQNLNVQTKKFNNTIAKLKDGNKSVPGLQVLREFAPDRRLHGLVLTEKGECLRQIVLRTLDEIMEPGEWTLDDELVPKDAGEKLKKR